MRENLLVVTGNPETKELKDMMPDILKQVGPQQLSALKDFITKMGNIPEGKAGEEDEDDVPALVGNFEDASKKWEAGRKADFGEAASVQAPHSNSTRDIGAKEDDDDTWQSVDGTLSSRAPPLSLYTC